MNRNNAGMARTKVDWDALEPHYRAGILTLKEIGTKFEVSDAAIVKHARNKKWDRNLLAKIQAKADAKVSAALVSAEVSETKSLTESVRIEIESEVQARIRIEHRSNITRMRAMVNKLLNELEDQTDDKASYQTLRELLAEEGDVAALGEAFNRAMSLSGRTKTMKDLADTIKTLIAMEREAYGIDKEAPPPALDDIDPLEGARRMAFILARASKQIDSQPTVH
jgi:hypothetical protein